MATVAGGYLPPQRCLREYRPAGDMSRFAGYVGLAMKAGCVAAGDMAATKALKTGEVFLLILAQDISPVIAKEMISLAEKRRLPLLWWPDKNSLGLAVGKSRRGALALMDKGFSAAIIKISEEIINE